MKYISLAATYYDGSISLLIFQWKYGAVRRSKHWKTVSDAIEIKIEISIENVHLIELNAFFSYTHAEPRPHRMIFWIFRNSAWKYLLVYLLHTHTHKHWQHGWMCYAIVQVCMCGAVMRTAFHNVNVLYTLSHIECITFS